MSLPTPTTTNPSQPPRPHHPPPGSTATFTQPQATTPLFPPVTVASTTWDIVLRPSHRVSYTGLRTAPLFCLFPGILEAVSNPTLCPTLFCLSLPLSVLAATAL
ncbi:unnamed protein product, partial [Pleuronectes platessa]